MAEEQSGHLVRTFGFIPRMIAPLFQKPTAYSHLLLIPIRSPALGLLDARPRAVVLHALGKDTRAHEALALFDRFKAQRFDERRPVQNDILFHDFLNFANKKHAPLFLTIYEGSSKRFMLSVIWCYVQDPSIVVPRYYKPAALVMDGFGSCVSDRAESSSLPYFRFELCSKCAPRLSLLSTAHS